MNINQPEYFFCSHAHLEAHWDKDKDLDENPIIDSALTAVEGTCGHCYEEKRILTQIGAHRFGVSVGKCFECLTDIFSKQSSCVEQCYFQDEEIVHYIPFTVDSIVELINRDFSLKLTDKTITPILTSEEKENLNQILNNPRLKALMEYQKKPHQCKSCKGVIVKKEFLDEINTRRSESIHMIFCLCCCSAYEVESKGCSISAICVECNLTASKICAYCADGAILRNSDGSIFGHDLEKCSNERRACMKNNQPLPVIRACDCPSIH